MSRHAFHAYRPKTTGMAYTFLISTEKADGSGKEIMQQTVVALNVADAWREAGRWVHAFMNGPKGRRVTDVQLEEVNAGGRST